MPARILRCGCTKFAADPETDLKVTSLGSCEIGAIVDYISDRDDVICKWPM